MAALAHGRIPRHGLHRLHTGLAQFLDKAPARDRFRAEVRKMRRCDLAVYQSIARLFQLRHLVHEGDLGCVAAACEHGFAEILLADRDAVEAADHLAVMPALCGVRITQAVQHALGLVLLLGEPGAETVAARLGALRDDVAKRAIETHLILALAQGLARLRETCRRSG